MGGSSIKDFHNSEGKFGNFQNTFKVYGQENKKCVRLNCTGFIKKVSRVVGQLSFAPNVSQNSS
jgi:Formamidopyrimidine-DNA glycosylase